MSADSSDEWQAKFERERAELDERYAQINRMWTNSGMPVWVSDTPDWQSGWRVLQGWLRGRGWPPSLGAAFDAPLVHANGWPVAGSPYWSGRWDREVHIFSHCLSPVPGHHMEHAALEEEGVRLVLEWWNGSADRPQDQKAQVTKPSRSALAS